MGYNLYTDLDSLYDTRFELIRLINKHEARRILKDGSYHERLTENYGNITWDMFYPLWRRRKKELFISATNTMMIGVIRKYFIALYTDEVYKEVRDKFKLYVNTYPYRFEEEEMKAMEYVIANFLPDIEVMFIYKNKQDLTTNWVSSKIGFMFKYDFLDWLDYQVTTGKFDLGMKHVTGVIPGVINGFVPPGSVTESTIESLEERFKMYTNVQVIDVANYSCMVTEVK